MSSTRCHFRAASNRDRHGHGRAVERQTECRLEIGDPLPTSTVIEATPYSLISEDVLPDQCYERGVLGRVVERIAHPDALKNQFRRLSDDLGVARLTAAEGARVDFSEALAQHIGEDLGRIEQESLPTPSRIVDELPPFPDCLLPALLDPTGRLREKSP